MNNEIRITKEFSFEAAHTLTGYDGACNEIHGHSYRLFVTVAGVPEGDEHNPKFGMAMDFGVLKAIVREEVVDRYDHSFMIRKCAANSELIEVLGRHFSRIRAVDYQPTCENMVQHFAEAIAARLPGHIRLVGLRLHETATSYAEYFPEQ